jgi:anaerobic selenocysteine-containing dehydrogenase
MHACRSTPTSAVAGARASCAPRARTTAPTPARCSSPSRNGKAIEIAAIRRIPTTRARCARRSRAIIDRTYSSDRVLHPMRRVGRKGEGRFARISWDEALDEIAERFSAIAASADGPQAILPYSYAGNMGLLQYASMDRRFFHRLGASLLDRTICASAGKAGWAAVIGASVAWTSRNTRAAG